MIARHSSRSQPRIEGSDQSSTARGRPSSEFPRDSPSPSGLVWACVGYGLSRTRNYDPILMPPKGAGGRQRSGPIRVPADVRYNPDLLAPCCGWRFGRRRTRHFWGCRKTCSEERACPAGGPGLLNYNTSVDSIMGLHEDTDTRWTKL